MTITHGQAFQSMASSRPTSAVPVYNDHADRSASDPEAAGLIVKVISGKALRPKRQFVHRHPHYELFWFDVGEGVVFNNFHHQEFKAGSLIFISPGRMHSWKMTPESHGWLISFTHEFLMGHGDLTSEESTLPIFSHLLENPILRIESPHRPEFDRLCVALLQEYEGRQSFRATSLRSHLRLLLVHASRLFPVKSPATTTAVARTTHRFLLLLDRSFTSIQRVQHYAAALKITPHRLIECVREQTGRTPGEIIDERLLLEGKRLLFYTDKTAAEIAYELSFKDPSHFGHFFKRHVGCSPGEARKRFKNYSS